MTEPIFVKVRNDQGKLYDSYTDYWRLVELSGFATCELDEVGQFPETYIFTPDNGNVRECLLNLVPTVRYSITAILWQLEIPGQVNLEVPNYFDQMWVSCQYWQSLVPAAKFVVLGGHPELGVTPQEPKRWDFCHLAYLYGKRAQQVAELEAQGYTMAPVGWGEVRNEAIAYSRWGLILHQNPVPALSPQRMTLFACSKLPMVAEACDPFPYDVAVTHVWPPEVPDVTDTIYQAMIERNYHYFTETMTFRKAVEGAL